MSRPICNIYVPFWHAPFTVQPDFLTVRPFEPTSSAPTGLPPVHFRFEHAYNARERGEGEGGERMQVKPYLVGQTIRFLAREAPDAPELPYTGHVLQVAHINGEVAYVVTAPLVGLIVPWQKVIGRVRLVEVVESS